MAKIEQLSPIRIPRFTECTHDYIAHLNLHKLCSICTHFDHYISKLSVKYQIRIRFSFNLALDTQTYRHEFLKVDLAVKTELKFSDIKPLN